MQPFLIVLIVLAVAAVVIWIFARARHPERIADRAAPGAVRSTSDDLYGGADRPAGPDAEVMDPDKLGGDQRPPDH